MSLTAFGILPHRHQDVRYRMLTCMPDTEVERVIRSSPVVTKIIHSGSSGIAVVDVDRAGSGGKDEAVVAPANNDPGVW